MRGCPRRVVVFVLDRSGSMAGGNWKTLVDRVLESSQAAAGAPGAVRFGLVFFNQSCDIFEVDTPAEVEALLSRHGPRGGTLLYGAMSISLAWLHQWKNVQEFSVEVYTDDATADSGSKDEVVRQYVDFFGARASKRALSTRVVVRSWSRNAPGPLAAVKEGLLTDRDTVRAIDAGRFSFDVISPKESTVRVHSGAIGGSTVGMDTDVVLVPELLGPGGRSIEEELVLEPSGDLLLPEITLLVPRDHEPPDEIAFCVDGVDPAGEVIVTCGDENPGRLPDDCPFEVRIRARGGRRGFGGERYRALVSADLLAAGRSCGQVRFELNLVRPANAVTAVIRKLTPRRR